MVGLHKQELRGSSDSSRLSFAYRLSRRRSGVSGSSVNCLGTIFVGGEVGSLWHDDLAVWGLLLVTTHTNTRAKCSLYVCVCVCLYSAAISEESENEEYQLINKKQKEQRGNEGDFSVCRLRG